ncbi:MAG TPA: hypothetical protein VK692_01095, partial [Chthoniobacterales bacterium]|nr:hypothetical protein [Chthoniobacterales bacterium]
FTVHRSPFGGGSRPVNTRKEKKIWIEDFTLRIYPPIQVRMFRAAQPVNGERRTPNGERRTLPLGS